MRNILSTQGQKTTQKLLLACLLLLVQVPLLATDEDATVEKKTPGYVSLGKPMVLNLTTGNRRLTFLQLQADVLVADESSIPDIKIHVPAIRHELVMLLSEQSAADMKSPLKREEVRQQATANIKTRIKEISGNEDVQETLFSKFLVQ